MCAKEVVLGEPSTFIKERKVKNNIKNRRAMPFIRSEDAHDPFLKISHPLAEFNDPSSQGIRRQA